MQNTKIIAKILHDDDQDGPREWDNAGTMVCWHRNYILGDEQPKCDPEEYLADLPEGTLVLPLYLYDHGGISMNTGGFSCAWDSGQVGFIYATPETIAKEWNGDRDAAEQCLKGEVAVYDAFIRGNVYGYTIERVTLCDCCGADKETEDLDSCWGFYDMDGGDCLADIIGNAGEEYAEALTEAWENRF
jgi:hypothetical protein